MWSITAVAGLVVGVQVALVAPAHATTAVWVSGSTLAVQADLGRNNDITLTLAGALVRVRDAGDTVTAGSGCTQVAANIVDCAGVTGIEAGLYDGNDRIVNATSFPSTLKGHEGNDRILGGSGDDILDGGDAGDQVQGGPGRDQLIGGAGNDQVSGDAGNDLFWADPLADGADTFSGGADIDLASYEHRTVGVDVRLDGAANDGEAGENDNIGADVEWVNGTPAIDTLVGSAGPNQLRGLGDVDRIAGLNGDDTLVGEGGDDIVIGGLGIDRLLGGPGDDRLDGVDAAPNDVLNGDVGTDTCPSDIGDILISC
ncbi:calcium-binding protein [Nonomuraea insulae]|uniref:Calcium-binding protein n=1 Tax=Nonomuraea insulae TaxID=1616787 RepID=A0ABW1D7I4_9ACTN